MKRDRLQAYLLILTAIVTICVCVLYDNFSSVEFVEINLEEAALHKSTKDINTATKEDLMMVSGIGEVIADRILEYRESLGGFKYMEELHEVEGIGDSKYEEMLNMFHVG